VCRTDDDGPMAGDEQDHEADRHRLVRDVMATAAPLIAKKDNRLILQMPVDPGVIGIDGLKLRQSLLNLLSNAAKFTSRGRITLSVVRRRQKGEDMLILEVRDTGIGMSSEGLNRLFEEFSQAEHDTSQKFGGTGLGLALTRRFCALMGGSISVESKLGQGSSFTIEVPARAAPVAADVPLPAEAA